MTSPTSGVSGNSAANAASAQAAANAKSKNLGDKDTFMKLLVAQLKYQDPSKPADSTQFLAQTAQFTQVEKLGDIADLLKSQRLVGASSLVGHTVNYMDGNGATQTGTISAAKLNGDSEPMLRIGNMDVLLSKVTEVLPTVPSTGAAPMNASAPTTAPAAAPRSSTASTEKPTGTTSA